MQLQISEMIYQNNMSNLNETNEIFFTVYTKSGQAVHCNVWTINKKYSKLTLWIWYDQ